jgi:hypothetical protein
MHQKHPPAKVASSGVSLTTCERHSCVFFLSAGKESIISGITNPAIMPASKTASKVLSGFIFRPLNYICAPFDFKTQLLES